MTKRKPRPMTKRDFLIFLMFFGLLILTAAAFACVEDRVNSHGFDSVAIFITVVSSLLFIAGILKLGRIGRPERAAKPSERHDHDA
jgi:hypothetical protein